MSDTPTPSQAAEKAIREMPVVAYHGVDRSGYEAVDLKENFGLRMFDPGTVVAQALVLKSDAESQIAELRAEVERLKKREPQDLPARVQVLYCPGAWDTFIYGVSGHLTMEALTAIDAAIRDEDAEALFDKGPGSYILNASYFKGQYGFEGRCEIKPGWELTVESFAHLDAALAADGKDGAHGNA